MKQFKRAIVMVGLKARPSYFMTQTYKHFIRLVFDFTIIFLHYAVSLSASALRQEVFLKASL